MCDPLHHGSWQNTPSFVPRFLFIEIFHFVSVTLDHMVCMFNFYNTLTISKHPLWHSIVNSAVTIPNKTLINNTFELLKILKVQYDVSFSSIARPVFKAVVLWRWFLFVLIRCTYWAMLVSDLDEQYLLCSCSKDNSNSLFSIYECLWACLLQPMSTTTVITGNSSSKVLLGMASCFSSCLAFSISSVTSNLRNVPSVYSMSTKLVLVSDGTKTPASCSFKCAALPPVAVFPRTAPSLVASDTGYHRN